MGARFEVVPEFITKDEQQELIAWFDHSLENKINLVHGITTNSVKTFYRKTTRLNDNSRVKFPKLAYELLDRILKYYGLHKNNVQMGAGCKDGMIAVVTLPKGDTYPHKDPSSTGLDVTFNILVQAAEDGAVLKLDGLDREFPERSLHSYCACKYEHEVSEVKGNQNRYLWIFRVQSPEWDIRDKL